MNSNWFINNRDKEAKEKIKAMLSGNSSALELLDEVVAHKLKVAENLKADFSEDFALKAVYNEGYKEGLREVRNLLSFIYKED